MKKILLTGPSGFLGQHVMLSFCKSEIGTVKIFALVRRDDLAAQWRGDASINPVVTPMVADLTDNSSVQAALTPDLLDQIDVCVHCAAMASPRLCEEDLRAAERINVPKFLFRLLAKHNVRVIALSTDQVYDGGHAPYLGNEEARPCNVYGCTKLTMERFLLLNNPQSVCLRSSIILGPRPTLAPAHDTFLHFIASRQGQETTFYTDEKRCVVFVEDVIRATQYFVAHAPSHATVLNMGGPRTYSRLELAEAVFDHLGFDKKVLVSQKKSYQAPGPVQSPLDISMDSSKLYELVGTPFANLETMIEATLGSTS